MTKSVFRFGLIGMVALVGMVVFASGVAAQEEEEASSKKKAEESESTASDGTDEEAPRRRTYNEAKLTVGDEEVRIIYPLLQTIASPDYDHIAGAKSGQVVQLTQSTPPKLLTDVDLTFGDAVVKTENVAKNYPGVYGLWLKPVDNGWHLVFNTKADVWGTMHDPAADVAEVPLSYTKSDEPVDVPLAAEEPTMAELAKLPKLKIALTGEGGGGTLSIEWGAHAWSADFTHGG